MPCFNWDLSKKWMHASAILLHCSSLFANLAIFFRIIILLCQFCCMNIFSWEKVILFMSLYIEVNVFSTMHFIKLITIVWSVYCPNNFLFWILHRMFTTQIKENLYAKGFAWSPYREINGFSTVHRFRLVSILVECLILLKTSIL